MYWQRSYFSPPPDRWYSIEEAEKHRERERRTIRGSGEIGSPGCNVVCILPKGTSEETINRVIKEHNKEIALYDELKQALQDTLYLLTEEVPIGTFKNYVEHNGVDEGIERANDMITNALQVLGRHMNDEETKHSPLVAFNWEKR